MSSAGIALDGIVFGSVAITARALVSVQLDLTIAQWRVLVIVGDGEDGVTMTEIADRLGAEVSPASRLVGRVVRRGLLDVGKDARDRRVTRAAVTPAGRAVKEVVLERRRTFLREILSAAGPIGPEAEAALERVASAFGRYL